MVTHALVSSYLAVSSLSLIHIYNTTMNLPLDVDETYDVDTGYYTVHIQIKDGAARFVDCLLYTSRCV